MKDLFIDIGARDGEEARSLVRLGDGAVLAPQPVELATTGSPRVRGTTVSAATSRSRPRAASPRRAARRRRRRGRSGRRGSRRLRGARTTAYAVRPGRRDRRRRDVRRRTFRTASVEEMGDIRSPRAGARARRAAQRARLRPALETAEQRRSPTASRSSAARPTPTPTRITSAARASPTGLVSVPTRYIHTPTELVSLDDVEARCGCSSRSQADEPRLG